MPSEILSTARPSPIRLWGFLCLAAGGLLLGLGATRTWATIGFPGDAKGVVDVQVAGTDVWEGVVVLAAGVVTLVGMIAMRLLVSPRARRAVAVTIVTLGIVACALVTFDLVRLEDRFGGSAGLDQIAASIAGQLDLPVDDVLAQLQEQFGNQLRVDAGPGIWIALAGGVLTVAGGILSMSWIRRQERSSASREAGGDPVDLGGDLTELEGPAEEPSV
jgi:hypothetical protein